MNILYLENSRGYHWDLIEILKKRGHNLIIEKIPDQESQLLYQLTKDKDVNLLEALEKNNWDIVFSLDYYPSISIFCNRMNKYYVSWNLEPPFSNLYSSSIIYSTNLVFTADKWLAGFFREEGIRNVFYLPEGVNIDRCERKRATGQKNKEINCSMIGNSKILSWQKLFQTEQLLDATLGYLDGMIASQKLIYGYDFFEKGLPDYLYKDLMKNSKICFSKDSVQSIQQFYAEQCFYPKMTSVDRTIVAKVLAKVTNVNVYTDDEKLEYECLLNCGVIPYENRLEIIDKSKINVSVSPRGLKNGIYGHNLYIMGMGGFLITDYRSALTEEFIPGKDLIIYQDMKHLAKCVEYYLNYPEEREEIGKRAYQKIVETHSLEKRIEVIEKRI